MLTGGKTIRDYVTGDFRTAAVFEKYGLDFCCGGGVALSEACRKSGIDPSRIEKELAEAVSVPPDPTRDPAAWSTGELVQHIVSVHHGFVRSVLPVLQHHAGKVARVHGSNHPETVEIAALVDRIAGEMMSHMHKEEMILFPYLTTLAQSRDNKDAAPAAPFGSVRNPIGMMEAEHQSAGDEMSEIRRLSNGYTPPADACTTFQVLYQELAQFEADLHRHVHLENNILFPRAIAMEEEAWV
jgi:regulator of cell morphogenesis and NO signaling